ncbi:MAG: DNA polymerase I, partial [Sinobacteraceae bacterium]|nr:DNA polymerase I [Nevskiaceae bacterium]
MSKAEDRDPVILVDASGWLFRAYHALPPLTGPAGQPTGAIYGMLNMLQRLLRDHPDAHILVVFDAPGGSFRSDIYADYKANRDATPEDLKSQFPKIVELVEALGLPLVAVEGVEADDVLGSYARAVEATGEDALIVTSDKDLAQLVTERVNLLDTMKQRRMDPAGVVEKFGVPATRIIEYLALMGDSSDNIPGVPLWGKKTAAKWLNHYGDLDAILVHADDIKGKAGQNLRDNLEQLAMARELATIRTDVPLPLQLDALAPQQPDTERLAEIYRELGFGRQLKALDEADNSAQTPPATGDDADGDEQPVETPPSERESI